MNVSGRTLTDNDKGTARLFKGCRLLMEKERRAIHQLPIPEKFGFINEAHRCTVLQVDSEYPVL